jgi:hypothetical protein
MRENGLLFVWRYASCHSGNDDDEVDDEANGILFF